MTRRRYDFMDSKPRWGEVLFWLAVAGLILLALGAFAGGCR